MRTTSPTTAARTAGLATLLAPVLAPVLAALSALTPAPRAVAQDAPPFSERQRITAVDVVLELDEGTYRRWRKGSRGRPVTAEEFSVRADGISRPVVSLESPDSGARWTQLIVFDVAGSPNRLLRWGASLLAEHAESLAALGPVEIWLSRPEMLQLLAATEDVASIRDRLSQLALTLAGDDRLAALRMAAAEDETVDRDAARCAELSATLSFHDRMLRSLVERPSGEAARRALYWVTGGFATGLHEAYGAPPERLAEGTPEEIPGSPAALMLRQAELEHEATALGEALAGYGWTTLVLMPPPADPLRGKGPGWRLGKWRFLGPAAVYESERDPEKAESFIELGDVYHQAGDAERAADAYDSAYYHFWGDPRTSGRQAVALIRLSGELKALGRDQEARQARSMALELDPDIAPASATDIAPWAPAAEAVQAVALATAGQRVASRADLEFALRSLVRRVRLTFQLEGSSSGRLLPLEVRLDDPTAILRAPWRIRSGPPRRLAAARARLALDGERDELGDGDEPLRLEARPAPPDGLQVDIAYRGGAGHGRMTVAVGDNGGCTRLGHLEWLGEAPPEVRAGVIEQAAVILWQDLDDERWGGVRRRTGL